MKVVMMATWPLKASASEVYSVNYGAINRDRMLILLWYISIIIHMCVRHSSTIQNVSIRFAFDALHNGT